VMDTVPIQRVPSGAWGSCCSCGEEKASVRNVIMLRKRSPIEGRGWGCLVCKVPSNGAVAVVCDRCLRKHYLLEIHNARIGMVIAQTMHSPRGRIEFAGGALVIRAQEDKGGGPK
jgi:hypothetical protein